MQAERCLFLLRRSPACSLTATCLIAQVSFIQEDSEPRLILNFAAARRCEHPSRFQHVTNAAAPLALPFPQRIDRGYTSFLSPCVFLDEALLSRPFTPLQPRFNKGPQLAACDKHNALPSECCRARYSLLSHCRATYCLSLGPSSLIDTFYFFYFF